MSRPFVESMLGHVLHRRFDIHCKYVSSLDQPREMRTFCATDGSILGIVWTLDRTVDYRWTILADTRGDNIYSGVMSAMGFASILDASDDLLKEMNRILDGGG